MYFVQTADEMRNSTKYNALELKQKQEKKRTSGAVVLESLVRFSSLESEQFKPVNHESEPNVSIRATPKPFKIARTVRQSRYCVI
jgi:hypothetical protein